MRSAGSGRAQPYLEAEGPDDAVTGTGAYQPWKRPGSPGIKCRRLNIQISTYLAQPPGALHFGATLSVSYPNHYTQACERHRSVNRYTALYGGDHPGSAAVSLLVGKASPRGCRGQQLCWEGSYPDGCYTFSIHISPVQHQLSVVLLPSRSYRLTPRLCPVAEPVQRRLLQ